MCPNLRGTMTIIRKSKLTSLGEKQLFVGRSEQGHPRESN